MAILKITGDMHGEMEMHRILEAASAPGMDLGYVLVLGDFALPWGKNSYFASTHGYISKQDKRALQRLEDMPARILFIDGNHDNFDLIESFGHEKHMFGGLVDDMSISNNSQVIHLRRGNVYTIAGKTFLVCGGAESIDRARRIAHKSWWPQESVTDEDIERTLAALDAAGGRVDFVLTHDAPGVAYEHLRAITGIPMKPHPSSLRLDRIYDAVNEDAVWLFGHHHTDAWVHPVTRADGTRPEMHAVYTDIITL